MAPRTLQLALAVSVALNLLLVSGIVGAVFTWTRVAPVRAAILGRQPLRFAGDGLSPDHRTQFRATIRATNRSLVATVQEARDARREAAALFVRPQFDRAAVMAALDRARAADIAARTRLEGAVVDFAAGLSPQERESLAERLRRGGPLRQGATVVRRGASPSGPGQTISGRAP